MSPEAHALLSASGADRWIHCPPSARLTADMPDTTSVDAKKGTLAHAIAELRLRKQYTEPIGPKKFNAELKKLQASPHYEPEMDRAIDEYMDLVKQICLSFENTPHVAVELRLDLSDYVPESFGTGDCVIVGGNTLHIVDYKNGRGVPVNAEWNPQLMLYGLGALKQYEMFYPIERVILHVCQPHINHTNEYEIGVITLKGWGEKLKPVAQQAFKGEGEFACGDWCRFCKARSQCRARAEDCLSVEDDFKLTPPALLTNAEIGDALKRAQHLAKWAKDLEEFALGECLNGGEVPGWKAVEGRSNRAFTRVEDAFKVVIAAGTEEAMLYTREPITLTAVEKLLGKKTFEETLGSYIIKPPGKPTLAPETDARPAIASRATAEEDFR